MFKYPTSSGAHTIVADLSSIEKEKKCDNFHQGLYGHSKVWSASLYYKHYICKIFTKTCIIMSISINTHRSYVCDLLGPYILLVSNSIDLIKPIDQSY